MTNPLVQGNQQMQNAAQAARSVSGEGDADVADSELHAPDGAVCVVCEGPILTRQHARRSPAGLRHETCP
jgi:hypothetical protein